MNSSPIGIFDSGVGGTSIWKEIINRLPNEHTIYLADSKHAPYGEKPQHEILNLCIKNTEYLLQKGAKIIVVACNTATTNAIDELRKRYPVPFIGIEPAIKPAALATKTKAVGILATKGTLSSSLFNQTSEKFASNITIVEQEGTGLVPLIEQNKMDSQEMDDLLKSLLLPMQKEDIDYLVLGCSHYPYLIPKIKTILNSNITIIDSGFAVAKQTQKVLEKNELLNPSSETTHHVLLSNVKTDTLKNLVCEIPNTKILFKEF